MAVELGSGIQRRLAGIQETLRSCTGGVRWVEPGNLHVTLKFLGEVPQGRIPSLQAALDGVARCHPPLELRVGGLGAFPNCRQPKVVWAGIVGGQEALGRLARHVDLELARLGLPLETRPFAGHVTLGRVRQPRPEPLLERELRVGSGVQVGHRLVPGFCLVQSRLRPEGPVYTILKRFALEGGPSSPGGECPIGTTPEPEGSG